VVAAVAAAGALSGKPDPRRFVAVDARARTVALTLVAGYVGENDGFNFDGYGRGELFFSVPAGWRVRVLCENHGGMRHSCEAVSGAMTAQPAFRGASVPDPVQGLDPGSKATFSFVASRAGSYRLASLVPGDEEARLWDVLEVTRRGAPSVWARPGP